jgi:hypothetical protein
MLVIQFGTGQMRSTCARRVQATGLAKALQAAASASRVFGSFSEALLAKLRRESFSLLGERVPTCGYVEVGGADSVIRGGCGALHGL